MISNDGKFAQGYAAYGHRRQKYADEPYMVHVGQVVEIIKAHKFVTDKLIEAAWLHDLLEDTDTTKTDLFAVFDNFVVDWVWAVTGTGRTRRERNQSIYYKCRHYFQPTAIKVADRLANTRYAIEHKQAGYLKMYRKEYDEFHNALRDDSMVQLRPLWDELDSITRTGN